jgi:glycosyltransferase involved in cell wall biosynthesis
MGSADFPTFSAVVLTRNEEIHVRECLEHLKWCRERILVDMESQDRTRELARDLATTIILHGFNPNFEVARNCGIEAATGDWVLVVDADELIPEPLAERLRAEAAAAPSDVAGFWIPRMNYCFGRPVPHVGGFPDYQLRLFRRGAGHYPERLHSAAQVDGRTIPLPVEDGMWILHVRKNAGVSDLLRKWDDYATTEARNRLARGERFQGPLAMLWVFLSAFRSRFFQLKGHRDGMPGLVLSVLFAFYRLEVEAKIWELGGCETAWDSELRRLRSLPRILFALAAEGGRRLCNRVISGLQRG